MAFARGLQFALLLTFVYVVTIVTPAASEPRCDVKHLKGRDWLHANGFEGDWYLKVATDVIPSEKHMTGSRMHFVAGTDREGPFFHMTETKYFKRIEECNVWHWHCRLHKSELHCKAVDRIHVFTIVTIDYKRVFGMWSENYEDGMRFPAFSLYVRDYSKTLHLSSIKTRVKNFCGEEAVHVESKDFYRAHMCYKHMPFCFRRGFHNM